jgi:hypothetical protein
VRHPVLKSIDFGRINAIRPEETMSDHRSVDRSFVLVRSYAKAISAEPYQNQFIAGTQSTLHVTDCCGKSLYWYNRRGGMKDVLAVSDEASR